MLELSIRIFDGIWHIKLSNIVKRNPAVGLEDKDGSFTYKQGAFTVRYRVISSSIAAQTGKVEIDYIKKDLQRYERRFIRFKRKVSKFWLYRRWTNFLKPAALFLLLLTILLPYYILFEPQTDKEYRLRWFISKALGVSMKDVVIGPDGWLIISATRITAGDEQNEPISFNVDLIKWLTFQDDIYVIRDRGVVENYDYGYVIYPVKYYGSGSLMLEKDGKWIEGTVYRGDKVIWEEAQGTGIRAGAVHEQRVDLESDKILIHDK
ncbi:MAG: hypothetical protein PHI59_01440 [Candidatus Omnitrophica bacterium]|nr:hypothetical protein [Candidatus Omnitrophota bacterium]